MLYFILFVGAAFHILYAGLWSFVLYVLSIVAGIAIVIYLDDVTLFWLIPAPAILLAWSRSHSRLSFEEQAREDYANYRD